MRPFTVPPEIERYTVARDLLLQEALAVREAFATHFSASPEVSIVIPAFNEGQTIFRTLASLSASSTQRSFEVLVIDNNSVDDTAALAGLAGVLCLPEPVQGITPARNRGLEACRGRYILNADADTIYPEAWIDLMLAPLAAEKAAMVYGSHAFLPEGRRRTAAQLLYEYMGDAKKWINRHYREEAVNVYGFNSAFIRTEGLAVSGFDHPAGTNEDGWLAVKLRAHTGRKLVYQSHAAARVWTSSRRLITDGGLLKATLKRLSS